MIVEPATTSELLRSILTELEAETISVDAISKKLGRRFFGGLFVLLAGVGLIPGLSFFAGLAMIVPACQLMLGFPAPILPGFVRRREVRVSQLEQVIDKLVPWIERVERFVRPRWSFLTIWPVPNLTGLIIFALACVIMLPLPFSNLPPAIALIFLALGLLEKDGVVIAVGLAVSAMALFIGVVVVSASLRTVLPVIYSYFP